MKTNEKITSAIIIALGVVVMGFALRSGIVTSRIWTEACL